MKKIRQSLLTLTALLAIVVSHAQEQISKDSSRIFVNDSTTLYTKVDQQPKFPGGQKAWQKFLIKTLRYPAEAQDNRIMGETLISFIVDTDGSISDIRAVDGDPILSAESIRIMKLSGKWEPAVYQGQKIKAYKIQPIVFRLI